MSALPAMSGTRQRIVRGQATLLINGDTHERSLGSAKIGFELKAEVQDLRTNEDRTRPIVDQVVTDLNGDVSLELMSFDPFIMAISHMANPYENWTQPALANGSAEFDNVYDADRAYLRDANGNRLYNVIVDPSQIVPLGSAVVDGRTGRVAFIGDQVKVVIPFTAPAVTNANRQHFMRLFSKPLIQGKFTLTQDNAVGTNYEYVIPFVSLATNGTVGLVASDGTPATTAMTMRVLYDPTQKPGFERGWATALGDPA